MRAPVVVAPPHYHYCTQKRPDVRCEEVRHASSGVTVARAGAHRYMQQLELQCGLEGYLFFWVGSIAHSEYTMYHVPSVPS
jgi:hypothetical protein